MARSTYTDDIRQAVLSAVATGVPISELSQRFGVPEGTIYSWLSRGDTKPEQMSLASLASLARNDTGSQVGRQLYDYLTELLTTLSEQSKIFRSEEWLRKQSAAELAALHAQLSDRAFQLLAAMSESTGSDALPG